MSIVLLDRDFEQFNAVPGNKKVARVFRDPNVEFDLFVFFKIQGDHLGAAQVRKSEKIGCLTRFVPETSFDVLCAITSIREHPSHRPRFSGKSIFHDLFRNEETFHVSTDALLNILDTQMKELGPVIPPQYVRRGEFLGAHIENVENINEDPHAKEIPTNTSRGNNSGHTHSGVDEFLNVIDGQLDELVIKRDLPFNAQSHPNLVD